MKKSISFIKFSAKYCGPCRAFIPIWKSIVDEYKNNFTFIEYDVDDNSDITKEYNITSIPVILVFDNIENKILETIPAPLTREKIIQVILRYL